MNQIILTHDQINVAAKATAKDMAKIGVKRAYPIPRGGVPAAYAIQRHYPALEVVNSPLLADCYIDDLIDSGATKSRYSDMPFFTLYNKQETGPGWIVFPWEGSVEGSAEDIGIRLLQFIGEDPSREGLLETPTRYLKAWKEWTKGYSINLASVFKDFGDGGENYDEMILIDPIPFFSHCEHHLTPIFGTVHIAYIPNGRIAGLSKFCRLVDAFACRLQVQERLTTQISDFIEQALKPLGVGVVIKARHLCMESRGAKKPGVATTTSALRGVLKDNAATRTEFFAMVSR